jgi:hypothetical protein
MSEQILGKIADRAELQVSAKDGPDFLGLLFDDRELLAHAPVAEGHRPSDPNPFAFRGGNLVPHSLADHLSLELGEGQEHVQREPSRTARRVEGLRDRNE